MIRGARLVVRLLPALVLAASIAATMLGACGGGGRAESIIPRGIISGEQEFAFVLAEEGAFYPQAGESRLGTLADPRAETDAGPDEGDAAAEDEEESSDAAEELDGGENEDAAGGTTADE